MHIIKDPVHKDIVISDIETLIYSRIYTNYPYIRTFIRKSVYLYIRILLLKKAAFCKATIHQYSNMA